ncbi:MAG: hypothetical protein WHT46_00465, partial [Candidatus Geothermincolales bacterium]
KIRRNRRRNWKSRFQSPSRRFFYFHGYEYAAFTAHISPGFNLLRGDFFISTQRYVETVEETGNLGFNLLRGDFFISTNGTYPAGPENE